MLVAVNRAMAWSLAFLIYDAAGNFVATSPLPQIASRSGFSSTASLPTMKLASFSYHHRRS